MAGLRPPPTALTLLFVLAAAGCAKVYYAPTRESVPAMSFPEAAGRLQECLAGRKIYKDKRFNVIADVQVSTGGVRVVYGAGAADEAFFDPRTLETPPVLVRDADQVFILRFKDGPLFHFYEKDAAQAVVSCANALYALKHGAGGEASRR